jgi:hypothetical protein
MTDSAVNWVCAVLFPISFPFPLIEKKMQKIEDFFKLRSANLVVPSEDLV